MNELKAAQMAAMTDTKCKCCGSAMRVRSADVARGWGLYCSKRCKALKSRSGQRRKRHDGISPMKYKLCQTCGAPAINGVYSSFGEDNGIEWGCAEHHDTSHSMDGDNFNNT